MPRLRSTLVALVIALVHLAGMALAQPEGPAARRRAALNALGSRGLIVPSQAAFALDDQVGFQQATDFQYLTGLDHLVGAVLLLDGPGHGATLFLQPPNPVLNRPFPKPDAESASRLELDAILPIDSLPERLAKRFGRWQGILVSPTDPRGAVTGPAPIANGVVRWRSYLTTLGWTGEVGSAVPVIRPLRDIKEPGEIAILARVGKLSGRAMVAGIGALGAGRPGRVAQLAVVKTCLEGGGRHSFWPWTMSGPRAVFTDLFDAFVDYQGHERVMKAGELVRVDVGCQLDHYMGDVGRTAPVTGRFDPGQREAWDLFVAGYRAGLAGFRDGASKSAIYQIVLDRIRALAPKLTTRLGKDAATVLLGPTGTAAWEIHGVGLDDAEGQPETLKAGMTVAYELMFAVADQGFYLEDMILVEAAGYRLLTPGLPYTAREIEAIRPHRLLAERPQ